MERVYDLGGGGIALEAVHAGDGDLIMKLRFVIIQSCSQTRQCFFWGNVKKLGGVDDVSITSCESVVRPMMLINTDDRDPVEVVLVVVDHVANSG
ncbi:hypothetical protein FRC0393_02119 [Corynebacterium diphtheriae]|nr:hypothetical protein [Corynebacterium diphtheriae]OIS21977.1 hypothetical protein BHF95_06765 [Corynebacterium diphtheriae]CAB0872941.1 hypothetical protein FRC0383_02121 [Corynebacterium diphtheriae]CAB0888656.1 hypothetical protein FRC0393_02119 [Corynebacterium diphtheriae]